MVVGQRLASTWWRASKLMGFLVFTGCFLFNYTYLIYAVELGPPLVLFLLYLNRLVFKKAIFMFLVIIVAFKAV